ncbi:type III secretion system cytoplasmic ring protein SctQ [Paraburkholderia sp. Ac-20347]|uniref:type III secretion system cytoplasmic ring protein SctQ n=1 Tax=Paraburkholderia sp. Ac-20347 TaxID=2703892 RepID=UPI00198158A7|nr:type III secretion system cytoplasmic ring protein SctQ [Paraburkholderia sp. Ac-20347]MBN3813935.1 YscQ/HrcQ family type III secretion apparatus protein [Paraburkholderia sp. Ac-20347]
MNAPFAVPATVDLPDTGSQPSRTRAYAQVEAPQVGPLQLPALSRAAARATRTIGDARFAPFACVQLGAQTIDVQVIDASRTQIHAANFADPAIVEIALSARDGAESKPASLRIALDLQAYPALAIVAIPARAHAPDTHNDAAEHALRDAVAGVLLEPMLTRIGDALACDARLVSVRRATLQADVQIALSFTMPIDAAPLTPPTLHTLRIAACSRALDLIDARLRAPETHPTSGAPTPDFPSLALPGSLIVGMKPLDVQTLRSLDVGDVLLRALFPSWTAASLAALAASDTPQKLESHLYDEDDPPDAPDSPPASAARPRALAAWGTPGLARLIAEIAFDGPAPVILKEPNMSEELDPANADAGLAVDQPDNPIHIGELELPVQFEIDTVALPLAQLSTLGPGYVVELPVPVADARLRLVAHGQTIGYGELVTVGEHLGIRIIRMAHRHGPVQ